MDRILKINGVSVEELKKEFGTPLYIFDENKIRNNLLSYKNNFKSDKFKTEVIYASKAFNVKEMLRVVNDEGVSLDCVSLGELVTALNVNFPADRIYMHGNNKSYEELTLSIEKGVNIVCDNLDEMKVIEKLSKGKKVNLYIRINVGVDAHTHKFIVTSHIDSKFGVIFNSEDYKEMMKIVNSNPNINLLGFHAHIGSQIFDIKAFYSEVDKLFDCLKAFDKPMNLDLGGGFGIRYTSSDDPIPLDEASRLVASYIDKKIDETSIKVNKVLVEPGRSIVAEAGSTLYTIGFIKKTPNRLYYFVDGGMTDNIRPSLYQAKYAFDVCTRMDEEKTESVCIAGQCCESGDILIENTPMQKACEGDLLITYVTGAYGYSMSSNYNKHTRPAVVFIKDGKARVVVKRQTIEDLISLEV